MFRKTFSHSFAIKGCGTGKIELVRDPSHINEEEASTVLVESFIGEYQKDLSPSEIGEGLTSWHDVGKSVKTYYEDCFKNELDEFRHGNLHYWVQASIDGKLVGWATFQRENSDPSAVYMNFLVVHREYQQKGLGTQLVQSLISLNEIPNMSAIHLLLRKKNQGGKIFYSKLGFLEDHAYQRDDKFVDKKFLEAWTWKNPMLQPEKCHR